MKFFRKLLLAVLLLAALRVPCFAQEAFHGAYLQGFPDGWTDIPGASDSARYKALGNSVAIPCVDFVMHCLVQAVQMSENIR